MLEKSDGGKNFFLHSGGDTVAANRIPPGNHSLQDGQTGRQVNGCDAMDSPNSKKKLTPKILESAGRQMESVKINKNNFKLI